MFHGIISCKFMKNLTIRVPNSKALSLTVQKLLLVLRDHCVEDLRVLALLLLLDHANETYMQKQF